LHKIKWLRPVSRAGILTFYIVAAKNNGLSYNKFHKEGVT